MIDGSEKFNYTIICVILRGANSPDDNSNSHPCKNTSKPPTTAGAVQTVPLLHPLHPGDFDHYLRFCDRYGVGFC